MADLIERFFAEAQLPAKLRLSEELTERTLAPVGGPWRHDEILGLPLEDDCVASGEMENSAARMDFIISHYSQVFLDIVNRSDECSEAMVQLQ